MSNDFLHPLVTLQDNNDVHNGKRDTSQSTFWPLFISCSLSQLVRNGDRMVDTRNTFGGHVTVTGRSGECGRPAFFRDKLALLLVPPTTAQSLVRRSSKFDIAVDWVREIVVAVSQLISEWTS